MEPSSLRDDPNQTEATPDAGGAADDSSSRSGIRPRISLRDLQRGAAERVTVVFHGTFPIEGLVQFIRRHAQLRLGSQPVNARIQAREGSWDVVLRVAGVVVVASDENPFLAAVRAFELLP